MFEDYENLTAEGRQEVIMEWVNSHCLSLTTQQVADILGVGKRTVDNWRIGRRAPAPFIIPLLKRAEPKLLRLATKK
jgi:transcriptional regulator with XRE-family HTH domain